MTHRAAALLAVCLVGVPAHHAQDCTAQRVAEISRPTLVEHVNALDYERSTAETQATASAYIQSRLAAMGYEVIVDPVLTSNNLIVRRTGTAGLGQRFVVGAHFDTVVGSPGADDNATGVAAILEIARVLTGYEPEQTVEIVAYALEEFGKHGSLQHAEALDTADVTVLGMISLDMIGYTCQTAGCQQPFNDQPLCIDLEPSGVDVGNFVFAGTQSGTPFMVDNLRTAAEQYVPSLELTTALVTPLCDTATEFQRSDHAAFWARGMPAMVMTDSAEARNTAYHGAGDTADRLDFDFLRDVTRAVTANVIAAVGGDCVGEEPPAPPPDVPNVRRSDTIDGGGE